MDNGMELHKVIYSVLLTQIQFGTYRYKENLPTLEEASARFLVSVDTVRAAYLRLKREGYITLSKNVGATIKVDYDKQETEQFIQTFFAQRKAALLDLGNSMLPLFGNAQWVGLKKATAETLHAMDQLFREENAPAPYAMLKHFTQKYSALGNNLFMRLVWQTFMFFQNPFFSIPENLRYFDQPADYLPTLLALCRKKDWAALHIAIEESIKRLSSTLQWFYETKITIQLPEQEISFAWSSYKKTQQICYSLAMELMLSISRGVYPIGSLLPSQEELAKQHGVSVSTVRRALGLLSNMGAIKSSRHVGTRVLPFDQTAENSDLSNPVVRRRLLDSAQSLQILALSCRATSNITLTSMDAETIRQWKEQLYEIKRVGQYQLALFASFSFISHFAPYRTIRLVYAELLKQLLWGHPLRSMRGAQENLNALFLPHLNCLIDCIEQSDAAGFATSLERIAIQEVEFTVKTMLQLGIKEAATLGLPQDMA